MIHIQLKLDWGVIMTSLSKVWPREIRKIVMNDFWKVRKEFHVDHIIWPMSYGLYKSQNYYWKFLTCAFKPNETNEAGHLFGTGNLKLGNWTSENEHVVKTWRHSQEPCCLAYSNRSQAWCKWWCIGWRRIDLGLVFKHQLCNSICVQYASQWTNKSTDKQL